MKIYRNSIDNQPKTPKSRSTGEGQENKEQKKKASFEAVGDIEIFEKNETEYFWKASLHHRSYAHNIS